ncbi:MAG: hypothetical protein M1822_003469 [Bathelium mastoideum]|nr:MAG: hypothetical protein M1822_003469 [Bathelium mastoideum]
MPSDAHQQLAASAEHDFYALLGVPSDADESTIKREYRKTSLKYHPDKNPDNPDAATKFQLLSDAREILLDSTLRAVYDNARRAQEQKQRQHDLLDSRRRQMKDDLENRERGFKRKQAEELIIETKIRRMAEEGRRRRKELDAQRMKEAMDAVPRKPMESGGYSVAGEAFSSHGTAASNPPAARAPLSQSSLTPGDPDYQRRTLARLRALQKKRDTQAQQTTTVS